MGNSESTTDKKVTPKEPSFVEILQCRATEAEAEKKADMQIALAKLLTEEARAKDIVACVDAVLVHMVSLSGIGERYFTNYVFTSNLFKEAWRITHDEVPEFIDLEKMHYAAIVHEITRRTGIKSVSNVYSTQAQPGRKLENPYGSHFTLTCNIGK